MYIFIAILFLFSLFCPDTNASDKENCLMCHKYEQIGRIDELGREKSYHVDEEIYANTTHKNVPCRDCHRNITKLPHDPITEEVDCGVECHIKPPFSDENFSHKNIIEVYNKSVHGVKKTDSEELKKAKPYCKYCHINPQYRRVAEERIAFEETLSRCVNCHNRKGVTEAYKHITHRLRRKTSRSRRDVVKLCSQNCHADIELLRKLNVSSEGLEAVETYTDSIHGKAVALGSEDTADCISCHATSAIHDIYKKDDIQSSVHKDNKIKTCKQCHKNANERFVQIDVHSSVERHEKPGLYFINMGLTYVFYGSVLGLISLMLIETHRRRKNGINMQIRKGTSWRRTSKRKLKTK